MDELVGEAPRAVLDLQLHRLHYTYSMLDLEMFREEFRYIFRNEGDRKVRLAPLLWRWRQVQANMYVLDSANSNLVYLPNELGRQATSAHLATLLAKGADRVPEARQLIEPLGHLIPATFSFEASPEARELAHLTAADLLRRHPTVEEFQEVATYLALARDFYLPWAVLEEPIRPGMFAFVRHAVDLYERVVPQAVEFWPHFERPRRGLWGVLWFLVCGRLTLKVPLALDAVRVAHARSFHCRVTVPPGLRVLPSIRLLPNSVFEELAAFRLASHDESNVYLYLSGSDLDMADANRSKEGEQRTINARSVQHRLKRLRGLFPKFKIPPDLAEAFDTSFSKQLQNASKVPLEVRVKLGIGRGMGPLVALLWIVAAGTFLSGVYHVLSLDRFLTFLGLSFGVVVAIAVFAIDKRILREFVSAHIMTTVAAMIVLYLLSRMLP